MGCSTNIPIGMLLLLALVVLHCSPKRENVSEQDLPNPLETLNKLLELHDLSGKQPEERSDSSKNRPVSPGDLAPLILDLGDFDSFLSNLYVGFVVGAVARHQTRLYVSKTGNRALVTAGQARIVLILDGGVYRISLKKSIPEEIARRAHQERAKIESQL